MKIEKIAPIVLGVGMGVEKVGVVIILVGLLMLPLTKGKVAKSGIVVYLAGLLVEIIAIYLEG